MSKVFTLWTWSTIFVACMLLSPAVGRHRTRSLRRASVEVDVQTPFLVWLPEWWAPEEREWGNVSSQKADAMTYYGQDLEDKIAMDKYFHGKEDLFYLEMGALDGVRYSNTLSFQKSKNSRGLLIEANPFTYAQLVKNRPHDINVNVAVCDTYQKVHYITEGNFSPFKTAGASNPAVGGILEFMPESFRKQWHSANDTSEVIPCVPLSAILKKLNVVHVDFWSLDVEGAELKVLETVNWNHFSADVIVIEADGHDAPKDKAVIDLLVRHGYIFDGPIQRNVWFHHNTFNPSKAPAA